LPFNSVPRHEDFSTLFYRQEAKRNGSRPADLSADRQKSRRQDRSENPQEVGTTFIIYLPLGSTPIAEETPKNVPNG
jgi:hypothetical protein